MSAIIALNRAISRRLTQISSKRLVSTSPKKQDSLVSSAETVKSQVKKNENWMSYGFEKSSKTEDRRAMNAVFFASVTLCLVIGGISMAYLPDYSLREWAQREAFLELRRREEAGEPLVSPDLIDAKKIQLPTDEELGDTEIII